MDKADCLSPTVPCTMDKPSCLSPTIACTMAMPSCLLPTMPGIPGQPSTSPSRGGDTQHALAFLLTVIPDHRVFIVFIIDSLVISLLYKISCSDQVDLRVGWSLLLLG